MVTDESSTREDGGGNNRPSSLFRYGDTFEDLCSYYMSLGMSYSDYWDGDNQMVKYYRQLDKINREHENYLAWLQGMYFYEALLDASPMFRDMLKNPKPIPYREYPLPMSEEEDQRIAEMKNRKTMEANKRKMEQHMARVNKQFKGKEVT